ncbi:macro domain-containing protein [Tistrella bauzanensis]
MPLRLTRSDITTLNVDAVVNSANPSLTGIGPDLPDGSGGVDGAIHRAAGPELYRYCVALSQVDTGPEGQPVRCRPGCCVLTPGFRLPALYILHAVAPRGV